MSQSVKSLLSPVLRVRCRARLGWRPWSPLSSMVAAKALLLVMTRSLSGVTQLPSRDDSTAVGSGSWSWAFAELHSLSQPVRSQLCVHLFC